MKHIYSGKTKEVYELPDGNYLLKFKDDATGKDGVFDPGENSVGLSIEGLGRESLALSSYFFALLQENGLNTHYISSNLDDVTMTVCPVKIFGKGLEIVCRLKATGSFIKRYGEYINEGEDLPALVEFTLKNDSKGDPPVTKDSLEALNIMNGEEFELCRDLVKKVTGIISEDLQKKGITLYDIKFELGQDKNGNILIADEISGGCMRAYKNGVWIQPMELNKLILEQ